MATYRIEEVTDSNVYCVVTRDNGANFGQMVHGAASKTEEGIERAIRDAIARVEAQAVTMDQKVVDAAISRRVKVVPVQVPEVPAPL